jgi:hypothetical protein
VTWLSQRLLIPYEDDVRSVINRDLSADRRGQTYKERSGKSQYYELP